jgi:hypothetical protein
MHLGTAAAEALKRLSATVGRSTRVIAHSCSRCQVPGMAMPR